MGLSRRGRRTSPSGLHDGQFYHGDWIDRNKNGVMDSYEDPNQPISKRVEDLLSRMTLEEKLAQLGSGADVPQHGIGNLTCVIRSHPPGDGAAKANEFQAQAIEQTRLGIPPIIHDECLHGCVAKYSTSFPQAIALAATWDQDLVYKVAKAIAEETASRGIQQCLSPVVDIARDVRAGRTEETYGEDPYLTSIMGESFCRAMREEDIIATPKHYVTNFVGEGGRDSAEIHFSERIIREVYFPSFRACIKAGALSTMAAYGSLDGTPCSSNRWLLTEVLRNEWGFEGFVVSDYGSVHGILTKHGVAATPEEAAKLALEAGLDVEFPKTEFFGEPLAKAVREGLVAPDVVDEAVRRILKVKFLIGLFDRPFVDPDVAEAVCGCDEHVNLALESARKAIVLLKNEGRLLPLDKRKLKSIAILGPLSDELRLGGYSGIPRKLVTPLEAIDEKVRPNTRVHHARGCTVTIGEHFTIPSRCLIPSKGKSGRHGLTGEYYDNIDLSGKPILVRTDEELDFDWGGGSPDPKIPCDDFSVRWTAKLVPPEPGMYEFRLSADDGVRLWLNGELLVDAWDRRGLASDLAQVRLEKGKRYDLRIEYCERTGEAIAQLAWDRTSDLPSQIRRAVAMAKKADVAVIFCGIVEGEGKDRARTDLPAPEESLIEEILRTGTPTVVVLLTGSAVTGDWIRDARAVLQAWYPGQEGGIAIAETLFGENNPAGRLPFTWPRYVGQLPLYYNHKPTGRRYDYVDMSGAPAFAFGYGLSYTRFEYGNLKAEVNEKSGQVAVSFDVRNIGEMEGDEVVQLYTHDVIASLARPVKELRRFRRVSLKAGEKKTIVFTLFAQDFAFLGRDMKPILEPGDFEALVGSSSEDIRLRKTFNIGDKFTVDVADT
jgi:beta-glucosidase